MKKTFIFTSVILLLGSLLFLSLKCKREGCTNPRAYNYDSKANEDDGSCIIYGCTNPNAANYDYEANRDDGSCIIYGCTDPSATNYNSQATNDNGSCIYPKGEAIFWTDDDYGVGNISVYVSNSYVGLITHFSNSGIPDCGTYGCVTIERNPGTYPFYAEADDAYWEGSITIYGNDCSTMLLYVKDGKAVFKNDKSNGTISILPESQKLKPLK